MSIVGIAAVQLKWKIEDYRDTDTFKNRVFSIMEDIRQGVDGKTPLLVVFPEDTGTPLLLSGAYEKIKRKTGFADAAKKLIMANLTGILRYSLRYRVSFIRSLMLLKGADMEKSYVDIFSSASKKYKAYICAGSITLPDIEENKGERYASGKDVYNISYFFGPGGEVIGKQRKVHLMDIEGRQGFDLSCGRLEDLKVFNTSFGTVGVAICLDGFKEDVCEMLSSQGADILLQPSANNEEWSSWQQNDWLNGSYLAVHIKKMFKYAVNPMMNGNIFDLSFEGQSSIISSSDTSDESNYSSLEPVKGFIKIADSRNFEEILISTIEI